MTLATPLAEELDAETLARLYVLQTELAANPRLAQLLDIQEDPFAAEEGKVAAEVHRAVEQAEGLEQELERTRAETRAAELRLFEAQEKHCALTELLAEERRQAHECDLEKANLAHLWRRILTTQRQIYIAQQVQLAAQQGVDEVKAVSTRLHQLEEELQGVAGTFPTAGAPRPAARQWLRLARLEEAAGELAQFRSILPRSDHAVARMLSPVREVPLSAPPASALAADPSREGQVLEREIAVLRQKLRSQRHEMDRLRSEAPLSEESKEVVDQALLDRVCAANARLQQQIDAELTALAELRPGPQGSRADLLDLKNILQGL